MPRVYTSKYAAFVERGPFLRRGKTPPYTETAYVDIVCPHCEEVCTEIPSIHIKTTKPSLCLQHLRECKCYEEPVDPPLRKKRKTEDDGDRPVETESTNDLVKELQKKNSQLVTSETSLIATNEDLRGRVHSLESQIESVRVEAEERSARAEERMAKMMQQIDRLTWEVSDMRERLGGVDKGLGIVSPPPPALTACEYQNKILSVCSKLSDEEKRSLLMCSKFKEERKVRQAILTCSRSEFFRKQMTKAVHPDKAPDQAKILRDILLEANKCDGHGFK